MKKLSQEDILRLVEEEDVEFIRLQFTDMFGTLKNIAITAGQLPTIFRDGCTIDASVISNLPSTDKAERVLVPDTNTFEIFPWRPQQGKVARMFCDVQMYDGTVSNGCARSILKKSLEKAKKLGYTFEVGPECEFFLFETDENANPTVVTHEQAGYFDIAPLDGGENARRDIVLTLEDMDIIAESSHHEAAPAQHEIVLKAAEALEIADSIQTFKLATRTVAKRHGLHATFMPKPKAEVNGSGMHIHMSLHKDGKNIFSDKNDPLGLSKEGYYFLGGIMKHVGGLTAITNPIVNSYKRLVPGFEAPVYIAWSAHNRSQAVRISSNVDHSNTNIELRSPDGAANPYLTLAFCLEAGLDGIVNKIEPPAPVDADISSMSAAQKKDAGIKRLPETLIEAVECFEADEYLNTIVANDYMDMYVKAKKKEWTGYNRAVSEWELNEYLNRY